MEMIVQWATILSPIIALLIAWWMSRSSEKDTAKQIASIKELAKIQIEVTMMQVDKAFWESKIMHHQVSKKRGNELEQGFSGFNFITAAEDQQKHRRMLEDLENEQEYYSILEKRCQYYKSQLEKMKKNYGGM